MAQSKETFGKREKEKKRLQQQQEKREKMQQRKAGEKKSMDDMIAYVDDNGNLTSTQPDPRKKRVFTLEEVPTGVPFREKGEEADAIRKGVMQFFNSTKGFGFIEEEGSGERIFVHISQLTEQIEERDKVQFEVEPGERGLSAVRVRKA